MTLLRVLGGTTMTLLRVLLLVLLGCSCTAAIARILPPRLRPGDTVAFLRSSPHPTSHQHTRCAGSFEHIPRNLFLEHELCIEPSKHQTNSPPLSPSSPPCQLYSTPGDCPAGFVKNVTTAMQSYGLNVLWMPHTWDVDEYLAGPDEVRAKDLMTAWANTSVKAIIATRGGNGAARMLHLLNFTLIAENPKIVMGYSDVTVVLNSIATLTGLVTFHGPMGLDNWAINGQFWKSLVFDGSTPTLSMLPNQTLPQPYTITGGQAKGKLIGGNLSLITNILGSLYAPLSRFVGAILFIEDVDEAPYKIDRYLTQLEMFGVLSKVAGVVFGQCTSCNAPEPTFSIRQVLHHHLGQKGIPVFANAMFGHIDTFFTLPIGVAAEIDADALTIRLLEPSVE